MNLTLHLTEQCNMACSYCIREKTEKRMSDTVLIAACDFAFSVGKAAGICFFGGEPLLEQDSILRALDYCREKSRRTGIPFSCKMTTNGTLLTADFLRRAKAAGMQIGLSFDGCAQDLCRRFADGSSSFSVMEEKAKLLLKYQPHAYAMATVAPEAVGQYTAIVKYLYQMGFSRIHISPAYGSRVHWTDLHSLKRELEKTAKFYRKCLENGETIFLSTMDAKIRDCIRGINPASRCHLGLRQMPVAVDGKLYPCTQFVGDARYCLGDVFHGIDTEKQRRMIQKSCMPSVCAACALNQRCTNSCGCINRMETGDENQVSPFQCAYERLLIDVCDRMADQFYAEQPELFLRHFQ